MRKTKRLLLMAAMLLSFFATGFAQVDKTSLLTNTDMEQGLKGWVVGGDRILSKYTRNLSTQTGFYGMGQGVLEAWNYSSDLSGGYIMQRVGDGELPNGTYVFGAYIGASKQNHRGDVCKSDSVDKYGDKIHKLVNGAHQYEYWSNRDSVYGVELFANEAVVPVATNNPNYNDMVCAKNGRYTDGHTAKFNVAVTLTDEAERKGTLDLGLRYVNTNANYVVWDNATLYYFGNMNEDAALDAMAEIDMTNAAAVADTLVGIKMNADTLNNLNVAIKNAKSTVTTAATLWEDSEELFWNMGLARKSIADYANLKKDIESAREVAAGIWREEYKGYYYANLESAIEEAQSAYEDAMANRAELTDLRNELKLHADFMRLDSASIALEVLNEFLTTAPFTNKIGEYSTGQQKTLQALANELSDTIDKVTKPGVENPHPQDVYPYIERVYAAIKEVEENPYDGVWPETLPQSATAINGYYPLEGSEIDDLGYAYTSPLIEFDGKTQQVCLTVTKVSRNQIFFCLSSLEFFDKDGNEIPLTAASFYSNADHNSVAGFNDGQSYQGLVDDDPSTYFHSDWSGKVTEPHYLEVTLPSPGYDAVYFKMVSRAESQRHQFPGEIVVTTSAPTPQYGLDNVQKALDDAKALNPYSDTFPVFYVKEYPELLAAMARAEALLENYTSEEDCDNVVKALRAEIDAFKKANETVPEILKLQEAYERTVVIAPVEGSEVGQYSDLTDYNTAIARAEELLNDGGSDEDMVKAIDALNEAVESLTPNMPEADKVYCIYNALPFEEKRGKRMSIFSEGENYLRWGIDNVLNLNQYWQFEPAESDANGYYIKNLANGKYIGELAASYGETTAMVEDKENAAIYEIITVNDGCAVSIHLQNGDGGDYLHANYHSSGYGSGGNVIYYYGADAGYSASAWYIESAGDAYLSAEPNFEAWRHFIVTVSSVGHGSVSGEGEYAQVDEVTLRATPDEGYHFVQWSDGSTANPYTFSLYDDLKLEATFAPNTNTYHIKYMADTIVVAEKEMFYGERLELPEAPEKEGYSFLYWDNEYERMPAHDMTVNAIYTVNTYHVSFMVDHFELESYSLEYGSPIVVPEAPEKEGYTFNGWSDTLTVMPAHNVTINAIYTANTYHVSFMIDHFEFESYNLEYGSPIVVPEAPELPNYTFRGWGEVPETVPAHDVTFYAIYEPKVYKVFYFVDGELVYIEQVAYGATIPEYTYDPGDGGDKISNWDGDTYETMPGQDITYTASVENGIDTVSTVNGQQTTVIYDLSGRKIQVDDLRELQKGVYIVNSRKVVVK